ncbi:Ribosomal protein 63, mitochondrial [Blomia tropicalis]|nr:Ribosomal protein 63, mitochondrial [Blomia tropicalis]
MRLSLILASFRREFIGPIPKHKGNVLIGKKRFVPPVTLGKKIELFRELKYEEEVMKYLSKSYITESQENKYLQSKGLDHPEYWDDFMRRPIEVPLKQHYAADYLVNLNINRSFEEED